MSMSIELLMHHARTGTRLFARDPVPGPVRTRGAPQGPLTVSVDLVFHVVNQDGFLHESTELGRLLDVSWPVEAFFTERREAVTMMAQALEDDRVLPLSRAQLRRRPRREFLPLAAACWTGNMALLNELDDKFHLDPTTRLYRCGVQRIRGRDIETITVQPYVRIPHTSALDGNGDLMYASDPKTLYRQLSRRGPSLLDQHLTPGLHDMRYLASLSVSHHFKPLHPLPQDVIDYVFEFLTLRDRIVVLTSSKWQNHLTHTCGPTRPLFAPHSIDVRGAGGRVCLYVTVAVSVPRPLLKKNAPYWPFKAQRVRMRMLKRRERQLRQSNWDSDDSLEER